MMRRLRIKIDDNVVLPLIHEFNRYAEYIYQFGYDQMFCWLVQCVVDGADADVPWTSGISELVYNEIESWHILQYEDDLEFDPDVHGYLRAVTKTVEIIDALMRTHSYLEFSDEICGCIDLYRRHSVSLASVNYDTAVISLELSI